MGSESSCLPTPLQIEFRANVPHECRRLVFCWKHSRQEKEITSLHCFRIDNERLRWLGELNAQRR